MVFPELRPLSFGELLDRSFSYYRRHFSLFVGIAALPQLFLYALTLAAVEMGRAGPGNPSQVFLLLTVFLTFGLYAMAYIASFGATSLAVSEIQLSHPIAIGTAYSRTQQYMGRLIKLGLAIFLRMFGCAMTLILIPVAVLMLYWYALAVPALMAENLRAKDALKRSRILTKGQLDKIFVMGILMAVIAWAVTLLLQGPFWAMTAMLGYQNVQPPYWLEMLTNFSGALAGALTAPLLMISLTLLYYDVRVRKEGYDLQVMMEVLPGAAPVDAPAVRPTPELERTNVFLMILLTLITFGLYYPAWFLARRKALNRLSSPDKLGLSAFVICYVLLAAIFLLAVVFQDSAESNNPKVLGDLLQFALAIIYLLQAFKVRGILSDHVSSSPSGPFSATVGMQTSESFSGVATFFFGIFYLQHRINHLREKLAPAAGESRGPAMTAH